VLYGAGSERALARAAAMRSRGQTWHQVRRLDTEDVPQTLGLLHPVWEDADPVDLGWADEQTASQPLLGAQQGAPGAQERRGWIPA
jgi:hypothetical protein